MTKEQNGRLRIRQCLTCSKLCKGTEWKRHKTESGHTRSWRRLFCSAHEPFKQAHNRSQCFIKKHAKCVKHKPISNGAFRQFVCDTRRILGDRHNLSPAEDSDLSSDYKTDDDDDTANINTEGESEGAISSILESDSDIASDRLREQFKEKVSEIRSQTVEEEAEVTSSSDEEAIQPKSTTSAQPEQTPPSSAQSEVRATPSQPEATQPTPSQPEAAQPTSAQPKAKSKGIHQQMRQWQKEKRLQSISREAHLSSIYDKYVCLQKQHKVICEENAALKVAAEKDKLSKEEVALTKAQNREKVVQVGNLTAKLEHLNSRLSFSLQTINQLQEENRRLKAKEEKARGELVEMKEQERRKEIEAMLGDVQRFELHIPHVNGVVQDDILSFNMDEDSEVECYQDDKIQCMHLLAMKTKNKLTVRQRNIKKRICRSIENPQAQRPRHN